MNSKPLSAARFLPRTFALLIDYGVWALCTWPLLWLIYGEDWLRSPLLWEGYWNLVLSGILPALGLMLFWISLGATPGKRMLGLRVINAEDGQKPGYVQALRRLASLLAVFPTLGFSYLCQLWRADGLSWHDRMAHTRVVSLTPTTTQRALWRHLASTLLAASLVLASARYTLLFPLEYWQLIPNRTVLHDQEIPKFARQMLLDNKILALDDLVHFYAPLGWFSYLERGALLTETELIIYWGEKDTLQIDTVPYAQIHQIVMVPPRLWPELTQLVLRTSREEFSVFLSPYRGQDTVFYMSLREQIRRIHGPDP